MGFVKPAGFESDENDSGGVGWLVSVEVSISHFLNYRQRETSVS